MVSAQWVCAIATVLGVSLATKDGSIQPGHASVTSLETFPENVVSTGEVAPGASPFTAQYDKLNSTKPFGPYGIEMRYVPMDADEDNATAADIFANLGPYTPWRPSTLFPETSAYQVVPKHCKVKQVHMLYRHGARYPTDGADEGPGLFGAMVRNGTRDNSFRATGDLEFMNNWNYSLGQALLVPQGAQEMFDAGVQTYYAYAKLLENTTQNLVIRTTTSSRVLDSARYWALGFFGWDASSKVDIEVLPEADKQNNTLEPKYSCPNGKKFSFGDQLRKEWQEVYLQEPLDRLQQNIEGLNLTIDDVANIISLCPYEVSGQGYSRFCSLFTKRDWENYEYEHDLKFQGNNGFMNPTGKAMGIGYVNEFLQRITKGNFSAPQTTQNATLDNDPTKFPLNQSLYVDFTHDTVMVSILTAFNFTQFSKPLSSSSVLNGRNFRASAVVPFGGRLVFEVLECDGSQAPSDYIRVKVNDAILPLDEGQGCSKRPDGLCKLDDFIAYARKNANNAAQFELACYGQNGTDFTVTGPVSGGTLESNQIHN